MHITKDATIHLSNKISELIQSTAPSTNTSEAALTKAQLRTLAQHKIDISPFLQVYVHKIDASYNPLPFCPLCNTQIHILTDTHFDSHTTDGSGFVNEP